MEDITKNKKYIALLETARVLFWKYGFRRVTIDEICREAKTSKMTFYRFFPNKVKIAKSVIDQVFEKSVKDFKLIMKEDTSVSEKMQKILLMKSEGTNDISNEFLQDFYNNPELGLSQYIEEKSKALWAEIIQDFKTGQNEGWIRKGLNVEFMYSYMLKCSSMVFDTELLKLFDSPQDLIMELTNMFVYGIDPVK